MQDRSLILVLVLVMVLGTIGFAGAGEDPAAWFNDPVQGSSPNATHEVGNDGSLGRCRSGEFPDLDPGVVRVELRQQNGDPFAPPVVQEYPADEDGDWGGPFPIPAGLDPGEYPLFAICNRMENNNTTASAGVALLAQGEEFVFEYDPRSYTVVADRDPAEPVEAEVTLTG